MNFSHSSLRCFARRLAAIAVLNLATFLNAQTSETTPPPSAAPVKNDEVISLSVFEVTTTGDLGYQSANAAEATRMNTPIEDIPMNVTVFNQQFIEDLLATDTAALLAYEPSAVKTTENDGFLARGSANVGSNFLNGFAQTSGFGSQPLANIERVEVIRGPAAVLYGAGGYGGVFNRITKQPRENPFTSARAILSDARSYRFEFDNTGPLPFFGGKKTLLYRVNGIHERGETWFGQKKKEDGIAPSLTWKIGPRTKLIFEYFYDWRENQASWETPMHLGDPHGIVTGDGTYHSIPRKTNWVIPADYRRNTRQLASYDLRHAFTEHLQFRSQFQYETKDQNNRETQALSDGMTILKDTVLMPRLLRYQPRETNNYRTRNELIWEFSTGLVKHRFLGGHGWIEQYDINESYRTAQNYGGLTGARLTGDGKITDAAASAKFFVYPNLSLVEFLANPQLAGYNSNLLMPLNVLDRSREILLAPGATASPSLFLDTNTKTYTRNSDLYVNDLISLFHDRFFLLTGARNAQYRRRTTTYASGTFPNKVVLPTTLDQEADATTSSFGAVWHLNAKKTFTLYGNLNTSFSPEYRSNPDGVSLDPEEGSQKEVGLRFSLFKGRIVGLVDYFDLLQDNVTQADPNRTGYFIQVDGQRSTGAEVSINTRITDNWLAFGGYAYTDARSELTGVPKDLQPKHRFTLFNRYNFNSGALKGLGLSLGTIYTGERPLTIATSHGETDWGPLPSYWRVDTIVSYKLRRPKNRVSYDFSLKVNNVFDNTDIYYVASYYRYTIDPGREWQAVVGVRF